MSYLAGWHAWYTDGSEYASTTHTPTQLPATGLQIWMLYFRDNTRRILHGNDHYFFFDNGSEDGVFACTDDPPSDIAVRYPGAHIISGELISDDAFRAILALAQARKVP